MNLHVTRAALLLLLSLAAPAFAANQFKSGVFEPPREAPEFQLQGSNGAQVALSRHRGKVVVIAFGFSHCPKICPVTLGKLSQVWKDLGPLANDVQMLFISVDPARDTPERLREWVTLFHPGFLGLTGTEEQLRQVRGTYGVAAKKAVSENKELGYEVHHSSSLYVVDREGKLRVLVPFGQAAADVVHDLKVLLAQ
jgi:protein SCO1/2